MTVTSVPLTGAVSGAGEVPGLPLVGVAPGVDLRASATFALECRPARVLVRRALRGVVGAFRAAGFESRAPSAYGTQGSAFGVAGCLGQRLFDPAAGQDCELRVKLTVVTESSRPGAGAVEFSVVVRTREAPDAPRVTRLMGFESAVVSPGQDRVDSESQFVQVLEQAWKEALSGPLWGPDKYTWRSFGELIVGRFLTQMQP